MVLEATFIVLDNSESSRNGDYLPTRWEAQTDSVHHIFMAKTQENAESSVGLMSMGGKGPEVLVTLTTEFGKLLEGMHRTRIGGSAHLATGIQIAGLALKHRQNKSQRQRIIVFSCSPVSEAESDLIKLAKRMKKNNVSVDFIAFGDLDPSDTKKLEAFHSNVNSGDGSHLAIIPPSGSLLSDQIIVTPIIGREGTGPRAEDGTGAGADGGGSGYEFGIDPSTDPELALALRMSMEEEKARQEKENKAKEEAAQKEALEKIPEEGSESQPLLQPNGEASTSADATEAAGQDTETPSEQKREPDDKMDTS